MSVHNILQEMALADYTYPDPGAAGVITVDRQLMVVPVVTTTATAITLAKPARAGQICAVVLDTDGGDLTLTVTGGYNQAGDTSIVFGDAGDFVVFHAMSIGSAFYWRILKHEGTNITDAAAFSATAASVGTLTLTNPVVSSSGSGAKNGATVASAEYGDGILHKTVLTCTATPLTFGDEAGQGQYGGVKIYDFPEGLLATLGAVISGSITLTAPAVNTWGGHIGLGLEAPVDHQDAANKTGQVMPKVATGTAAAKVAVVGAVSVAAALTESGGRWLDGTATAKDLFLNLLITDNVAHDNTITGTFTGTVTITWINLGDK